MKPDAIHRDINPHVIRYVLELPINHAEVFVRTSLEKRADGYVDGNEVWETYRRWKARDPMSESSFLAALEKAGFAISYDDDHVWYVNGWQWPGTKPTKAGAKATEAIREKTSTRDYTFTEEVLSLGRIREIALLCSTFNGVAEALGWPAKKFAIYRARFPRVEKAIEQVWRDNPDRFKQPEPLDAAEVKKRHGLSVYNALRRG